MYKIYYNTEEQLSEARTVAKILEEKIIDPYKRPLKDICSDFIKKVDLKASGSVALNEFILNIVSCLKNYSIELTTEEQNYVRLLNNILGRYH